MEEKQFAVFKFFSTPEEYEIVPIGWISADERRCKWPSGGVDLNKLAEIIAKGLKPLPELTWDSYAGETLKKYSNHCCVKKK